MAYTAVLSGFPNVLRVNILQSSGATSGRIVVDTTISAGAVTNWEDETTLVITTPTNTLTWSGIRAMRAPRVRKGYMRTVFEDSRWKLREITINEDWNLRDGLGNIVDGYSKTVAELGAILATASGISLAAGVTVPSFRPSTQWRGKSGQQAMQWLLRNAVCRLVYNPLTSTYKLWSAGAGSLPNLDNRLYQPGPDRGIGTIEAHSAPVIYEARLAATAVVDNAAGELEDLSVYDGDGYFDEFFDHDGNDEIRSRLIASAFRLWKIDSSSDKEILPYRALSVAPGVYASAKAIRSTIQSQMRHHPVHPVHSGSFGRATSGQLFVSDDPILDSTDGSLDTTAEILVGYHALTSGKPTRLTESRSVGSGASTRKYAFDWIRPVNSCERDIGTQVWGDLLGDVADALSVKFSNPTRSVTLPGIRTITESGRVGSVQYVLNLAPRHNAIRRVAFDFDPQRRVY